MTEEPSKTRNVKISSELIDIIKKRAPDAPPGETLFEIYKEYEYLELVARRVTGAKENEPIKIADAIDKFFTNTNNELAVLRKSHDDFNIMLQGLQMFFKKVK